MGSAHFYGLTLLARWHYLALDIELPCVVVVVVVVAVVVVMVVVVVVVVVEVDVALIASSLSCSILIWAGLNCRVIFSLPTLFLLPCFHTENFKSIIVGQSEIKLYSITCKKFGNASSG